MEPSAGGMGPTMGELESGPGADKAPITEVTDEEKQKDHSKDHNLNQTQGTEAFDTMPLGISVSLQTDTSWLHEHNQEKQSTDSPNCATPPASDSPASDQEDDLYSSLSDDLSELSILCDMEFSSDYMTFFEEQLKTLPRVGPPTIFAYKRESSETDRHLAMSKVLKEKSENELCEFCGNPLKPFPVHYPKDMYFSDELFCCSKFKNMFELLFKEQMHLFKKDSVENISIAPHEPYGSEAERQKAKAKAAERLRQRHLAKFFSSVVMDSTSDISDGKSMKTISFQLSNTPPELDASTIKPERSSYETDGGAVDDDYFFCDISLTSEKIPLQFVEKYYRTGRKFLTMFPDGTVQIFYPSGNLAVIVVADKQRESVCLVQEDKSNNAGIQAMFASSGKATCYHPNGTVWINITPVGGQYLDNIGRRIRRWKWQSVLTPKPYVQFKPIFISLNHQVGVRIIAQDQMSVSFLAMGKQAKINVGRRDKIQNQVKEMERNIRPYREIAEDELILVAMKIKILRLLNKLNEYLNFPSNKQWDRIKPPSFLTAQAQKVINLCSVCKINKETNSSIQTILGNSQ
ncbi:glutamate-rich protein 6 isoform X2 [Pelobates fuscus]|uniref:glutamate-rich protein 6 isoform X2 n=1 Tax=Pelobates fuscus TaxID=191477 RepID=UPI002FE4AB46